MQSYTTGELCTLVRGHLQGPDDIIIRGVNILQDAGPADIAFIGDVEHARAWSTCTAAAALVSKDLKLTCDQPGRALIQVPNADLAMAEVLERFAPPPPAVPPGIHPSAVLDPSAEVADGAAVGPGSVIGPNVTIGADTVLHGHVTVLDDTHIGTACVIWPGTVIRERCRIGNRCILHANTVIGADGFGYRPAPDGSGLVKIPQIGTVEIGDDVEIGAGTCIDRGKFSATTVGSMTKIDNLCQIAHGCQIGRGCVIAGLCGIAGSVTIGDGAILGGKVGIKDHVRIGAGARLAAYAAVMNDVPPGQTWAGMPAKDARVALRELVAVKRLPKLIKTLHTSTDQGAGNPGSPAVAR